jgi:carbon starvation protein
VFDTLDVCTRLGRYVLQELFGWRGTRGAVLATLITLVPPALVLWAAEPGSWRRFWTLFGASNQMLAALSLLAVTVWLWTNGRRVWVTLPPTLVLLAVTGWALTTIAASELGADVASPTSVLNGVCAVALLALAAFVIRAALRAVRRRGNA